MHSWIVQGKVQVDGKVVNKPGTPVSARAKIDILAVVQQFVCRYVCRFLCAACQQPVALVYYKLARVLTGGAE